MSTSLRSWRRSYTRAARASQLGERRVIRAPLAGPGHMTAPMRPPLAMWRASMPETPPSCTLSLRRGLGALPTRFRLRLALMSVKKNMKDVLQFLYCTLACLLTTCLSCRCQTTSRRCIQTKSPTKMSPTRRRRARRMVPRRKPRTHSALSGPYCIFRQNKHQNRLAVSLTKSLK